jgi:predicted transcriptional regulator
MSDENAVTTVERATELTIAWLGNANNPVSADAVPAFLKTMHATLAELARGASAPGDTLVEAAAEQSYARAITLAKSLASKDHIVSMIDGKPYKMLRRHLSLHGLTPEQYRERYKLKPDYPIVAESYSEQRRALAHKIGLGRKDAPPTPSPKATAKPKRARLGARFS